MHTSCGESDSDESVEERFSFKIVLLGPSGCGKTTLAQQLCNQTLSSKYIPTQGVDFYSTQITSNSVRITLQVWDVGGGLKSPELAASYLHACDAVLVVYRAADQQSRALAEEWLPALQQLFAGHTLPYLALVANTHGATPGEAGVQEEAVPGYAGEQLTAAPVAHGFQVAARQAQDVRQLFLKVSAALCGLPLAVTAGAVCTSTAAGSASCPEDLRGGGDDAAPDGVGDSMQHMSCWSWLMMCMRGSCCR